jgi:hypothetical protein
VDLRVWYCWLILISCWTDCVSRGVQLFINAFEIWLSIFQTHLWTREWQSNKWLITAPTHCSHGFQ